MYAQPIELKLKKSKCVKAYGFSIYTTENLVHFSQNILKGSIASKYGIEEGDCILAVNRVTIHKQLDNQEAASLIKQNPKKVHLLILKKPNYEVIDKKQTIEALKSQVDTLTKDLTKSKNWEQLLISNNKSLQYEVDTLQKQVGNLKESLEAARENMAILNHLLRMAIQQKLTSVQEKLGVEKKRQSFQRMRSLE
uniref:PDZ domain-containing protein n=1 Tax=Acrobeloides nanus TaxID=290746 RepID=A0A914CTB5_9BILA